MLRKFSNDQCTISLKTLKASKPSQTISIAGLQKWCRGQCQPWKEWTCISAEMPLMEGLKPDPSKVKAIWEVPPPTDIKGFKRWMLDYLAKFSIVRTERSFEKIGRQGSRKVLAGATSESIRHILRWSSHVKILLYRWIDYDINVIQGTPVWELYSCKRDNQSPLLPEHWPIQKQNQKSIISHVVY